ncbi:ABC transporter permease [Hymenobacter latericus]|uniref:ABC transporter permease n=1 Tax=Hymenobacter sp. YIM 151858-1 TaxID=2987688 RepID=UPI0022271775|nr:ABC transporter permease [Hymenobacter sp. YIM 151858-1]UYZ58843.1 ABC transporter permease [Hymenobacter sp. YIM 151858-1]
MSLALSPSVAAPSFAQQLARSLSADALKLRRTAALWLALGSGALPVLLSFCIYYFKGHEILKPGQPPWASYVMQNWQTATGLLLPLFVVLLTSLVLHIENKANAWKHLYAQPASRLALFASKLLLLLGLNLLAQVLYAGLLLLSGYLLGVLRPELHFQDFAAPATKVGLLLLHTYLATLGILALQYLAAQWWRSFVAPVAIGMGCVVAAMALLRWEHIEWVPYASPLLSLGNLRAPQHDLLQPLKLPFNELTSLGCFAGTLLIGYVALGFRHERVK